jgi:hypothetical protein
MYSFGLRFAALEAGETRAGLIPELQAYLQGPLKVGIFSH